MKKTVLTLLCVCLLLCGCAAKEEKITLTCEQLASQVLSADDFQELTPMTEKYIAKYLLVDMEKLSDAAFLRDATAATPEMILVLEAKETKDVAEVRKLAEEYLAELLPQYRDYQPDEMPKLENARVLTKGERVALIVAPDQQKAAQALEKAW